jgi:N-methylhydantoinase A
VREAAVTAHVRIGVDIGGTFTDVVAYDEASGRYAFLKTPSTPGDYMEGMREGLDRLFSEHRWAPESVELFFHGTTVATNTLLERTGARAGLIATAGFRDLLEIGRTERPPHDLYNLMLDRPKPLVRRALRLTVPERISAKGEIMLPLDEEATRVAVWALMEQGVEALAIAFLNAYVDPVHERRARDIVREIAPGLYVAISSDVNPQIKEFERTSTTVLSAYVGRKVSRYVQGIENMLRALGIPAPLHVMQASGGAMSREAVTDNAIRTILSGPAAGVLGAQRIARSIGEPNVITFDMGGTSTDVSLIRDGAFRTVEEAREGGYYVRVPMMDIATIGAGGGSIARVDSGGALKVGPESAGADPGPACYGHGDRPTVTDANVVLGYIDPDHFLGGEISLDPAHSHGAIERHVAGPLGWSIEEAASGIVAVANASMVRAIKRVSVERGHDVRDFVLLPYGGAGNLHGAALARELSIRRVCVPLHPGVLSACGLVEADLEHLQTRSVLRRLDDLGSDLGRVFAELEQRCAEEMQRAGFDGPQVRFRRAASLRYRKQVREVAVDLGEEQPHAELLREKFLAEHERLYGFRTEEPIEVVDARVAAVHPLGRPVVWRPAPSDETSLDPARARPAWLGTGGGFVDCPVYDRARLPMGGAIEGPAIVEQKETNTVVLEGQRLTVHDTGVLLIEEMLRARGR